MISGARSCTVTLPVGTEHAASIVGSDTTHDVAVVHVARATPDPDQLHVPTTPSFFLLRPGRAPAPLHPSSLTTQAVSSAIEAEL